jgi:hypothetical protein
MSSYGVQHTLDQTILGAALAWLESRKAYKRPVDVESIARVEELAVRLKHLGVIELCASARRDTLRQTLLEQRERATTEAVTLRMSGARPDEVGAALAAAAAADADLSEMDMVDARRASKAAGAC